MKNRLCKSSGPVVHDTAVVVLSAQVRDGLEVVLVEVGPQVPLLHVPQPHLHELVPVRATLLVVETQCVHQFVNHDALVHATISEIIFTC